MLYWYKVAVKYPVTAIWMLEFCPWLNVRPLLVLLFIRKVNANHSYHIIFWFYTIFLWIQVFEMFYHAPHNAYITAHFGSGIWIFGKSENVSRKFWCVYFLFARAIVVPQIRRTNILSMWYRANNWKTLDGGNRIDSVTHSKILQDIFRSLKITIFFKNILGIHVKHKCKEGFLPCWILLKNFLESIQLELQKVLVVCVNHGILFELNIFGY